MRFQEAINSPLAPNFLVSGLREHAFCPGVSSNWLADQCQRRGVKRRVAKRWSRRACKELHLMRRKTRKRPRNTKLRDLLRAAGWLETARDPVLLHATAGTGKLIQLIGSLMVAMSHPANEKRRLVFRGVIKEAARIAWPLPEEQARELAEVEDMMRDEQP